jgi:hypothetical protein
MLDLRFGFLYIKASLLHVWLIGKLIMRTSTKENNMESWQNGYCTGLENRRPQGLGGSNPSLSARSEFCYD